MGPALTDEEVFLAVRDRTDSPEVLRRLTYFSERMSDKSKEIDEVREGLASAAGMNPVARERRIEELTRRASRLSEDISRIESEREAFVASVLGPEPKSPEEPAFCRI